MHFHPQGILLRNPDLFRRHCICNLFFAGIKHQASSEQLLILYPVFLKYIKSVLPELDVNGVEQLTYEEFVDLVNNSKEYFDKQRNKVYQEFLNKM